MGPWTRGCSLWDMASDATMWLSGLTGKNIRRREERRCGEGLDRVNVNLAILMGKPCVFNLQFWLGRVKTCCFFSMFFLVYGNAQNPELSFTQLLHVTLLASTCQQWNFPGSIEVILRRSRAGAKCYTVPQTTTTTGRL